MISFLFTFWRLIRSVFRKSRDPNFRDLLTLVAILLLGGTVFYRTVEGWHWLDALYFCVVTLATVGYGDFVPHTAAGKIFTIIYLFVGLGLFVAIIHDLADDLFDHRQKRRESRQSHGDDAERSGDPNREK